MKYETWAAFARQFPDGADTEFLEAVRRATAPKRHARRVQIAARAALEAAKELMGSDAHEWLQMEPNYLLHTYEYEYRESKQDSPEFIARPLPADHDVPGIAAMLCALEAQGTGGPGDMGLDDCGRGDRSTVRAEWARGLGKGRAHATDGPAWTAAIRDAGFILQSWRHCESIQELMLSLAARAKDPVLLQELRSYAIRYAADGDWAVRTPEDFAFAAELWRASDPSVVETDADQEAIGARSTPEKGKGPIPDLGMND